MKNNVYRVSVLVALIICTGNARAQNNKSGNDLVTISLPYQSKPPVKTLNKNIFTVNNIKFKIDSGYVKKFQSNNWICIDSISDENLYPTGIIKLKDIDGNGFADIGITEDNDYFVYLFDPKINSFIKSGKYSLREFGDTKYGEAYRNIPLSKQTMHCLDKENNIYFDYQPAANGGVLYSHLFQLNNFKRVDLGHVSKRYRDYGNSVSEHVIIDNNGNTINDFDTYEIFDIAGYWKNNWQEFTHPAADGYDYSRYQHKFNKEETQKLITQGKSAISGQVFVSDSLLAKAKLSIPNLNTSASGIRAITVDTAVLLIPYTDFFKEWYQQNEAALKTNTQQRLSKEMGDCIKVSKTFGKDGYFEFTHLLPGSYLLLSLFRYKIEVSGTTVIFQTDIVKKIITIKQDNEKVTVKLSDI